MSDDKAKSEAQRPDCKKSGAASCYAIADRLEDAINKRIQETGKIPVHIYLGKHEWAKLCAFAEWFCRWKTEPRDMPPEYNGMEVYVVCDQEHLFVA